MAFAFDPNRQAMLLVAGDKVGADQKWFYKRLIGLADTRFDTHLASLAAAAARKETRLAACVLSAILTTPGTAHSQTALPIPTGSTVPVTVDNFVRAESLPGSHSYRTSGDAVLSDRSGPILGNPS